MSSEELAKRVKETADRLLAENVINPTEQLKGLVLIAVQKGVLLGIEVTEDVAINTAGEATRAAGMNMLASVTASAGISKGKC